MADARTKFFDKMHRDRRIHSTAGAGGGGGGDILDADDIDDFDMNDDIEFSITESGRTVVDEDHHPPRQTYNNQQPDYSHPSTITSTRKESIDSIGMSFTESERHMLLKTLGDDYQSADPVISQLLPQNVHSSSFTTNATTKSSALSSTSAHRSIPVPKPPLHASHSHHGVPSHQQYAAATASQPSSHGSSGSAFLSSVLNTTHTASTGLLLSHTPPTTLGTSYETSHFGKRARSGSVSGRLRSASEYLEDKGLLDRNTKGILKDLIIIGDEELQQALDRYEDGDPSQLEHMISSGALQNRLPQDLDILGDFTLDFLTVHDDADDHAISDEAVAALGIAAGGGKTTTTDDYATDDYERALRSASDPKMASRPSKPQQSQKGTGSYATMAYDDGIGDLDFAGEFVSEQTDDYMQLQHPPLSHYGGGISGSKQTSAAGSPTETNTTMSSDYERRMRSNSLFSALLNDEPDRIGSNTHQHTSIPEDDALGGHSAAPAGSGGSKNGERTDNEKYGWWMNRGSREATGMDEYESSSPGDSKGIRILPPKQRTASSPHLSGIGASLAASEASSPPEAAKPRQTRKYEKGKKEKDSTSKPGRKKKEDMKHEDAIEREHIPGSGMPRSLSDPNLIRTHDSFGLVSVERPEGWVGAYSPDSRKVRIERFLEKRNRRVWSKTIKYDVRKNFADSRLRVKGRFVRKEDELLMRELMSLT